MIPQDNDPCVKCKKWSNESGCEHYNSAAMIIFGACAHKDIKEQTEQQTNK